MYSIISEKIYNNGRQRRSFKYNRVNRLFKYFFFVMKKKTWQCEVKNVVIIVLYVCLQVIFSHLKILLQESVTSLEVTEECCIECLAASRKMVLNLHQAFSSVKENNEIFQQLQNDKKNERKIKRKCNERKNI